MRILLFCDFEFPDSCADASRVFNFAQIFRELGHEVHMLGVCYSRKAELNGTYKGFEYKMLKTSAHHGLQAGKRIKNLSNDIEKYLSEYVGERKYDAILLSNVYYDHSSIFADYSKKHGAKLIVNALEWFDINNATFKGLMGPLKFAKNRIALRSIYKKMGNMIAISSLLDDYYKKRGCNTVRIPTIVDLDEYASVRNKKRVAGDKIIVAYAGVPGKKDYVVNAIKALERLTDEERSHIELHFYGPTVDYFKNSGIDDGVVETYKENVICHGRIPYSEVKERISEADFTILLRPNKRYANAGFPTKVGESMACGTPVIANMTSDLDKYIIDGKTGIVCDDETPMACAAALKRAISMTDEDLCFMRENCLQMSEQAFSYKSYLKAVDDFLAEGVAHEGE